MVPTTLVLGAGASMPYGFPSGVKLREWLCNPVALRDLQAKFYERDIAVFCETFLHSGMLSIDAFLARRGAHSLYQPYEEVLMGQRTFSDIGKAAIALKLIECEKHDSLFKVEEDHWYQYLWANLADSLNTFGENNLSIITFNYDRSLEYYLLNTLQHAFGINEKHAADQLKKIPIIHVYGKLAELPNMCGDGVDNRFFKPDTRDSAFIDTAARGIKVIDEARNDDDVFGQARKYLSEAERICFLGFGFDDANVHRLGIKNILTDRFKKSGFASPKIYATSIGQRDAERRRIFELLSPNEPSIDTWPPYAQKNYRELKRNIEDNIYDGQFDKNEAYLRNTGVFYSG
ncbi:MAG: hypothetical protein ACOH2B_02365 [Burkholderiaceae bacterium]